MQEFIRGLVFCGLNVRPVTGLQGGQRRGGVVLFKKFIRRPTGVGWSLDLRTLHPRRGGVVVGEKKFIPAL
jgi:hypothetical protein